MAIRPDAPNTPDAPTPPAAWYRSGALLEPGVLFVRVGARRRADHRRVMAALLAAIDGDDVRAVILEVTGDGETVAIADAALRLAGAARLPGARTVVVTADPIVAATIEGDTSELDGIAVFLDLESARTCARRWARP